ncbi:MAG: hypothetical protein H6738_24760 [Alphaproteobacteria bacterium]|nr:hypothetical protein [Alphaproteobacteria bacterium]MCB9700022.1 hypothetical protein [Alphaproteobacteria bacterium]
MLLLVAWACGGGASDPVCDQYVSCAGTFTEQFAAEAEAQYAREGSCFQGYEVEECSAQCEELLLEAWWASGADEPSCDPAPLGIDAGITLEAFTEAYLERFCEVWSACSGDPDPCANLQGTGTTTGVECNFRPDIAQACLDGDWVCDESLGFPSVPAVCADVCAP